MANETETDDEADDAGGKRERSPNYPALTFTAALERAKTIWEKEKRAHVAPQVAARHLGYKTMNGAAFQTLGALKRYGLVVSTGKKDIRVSDDAHFIFVHPEGHADRVKMMAKLAMSPSLFGKILGVYGDDMPSDENLVAKLQTDEWGFKSEEAARAVVRALRDAVRVSNEGVAQTASEGNNNAGIIKETPMTNPGTNPGTPAVKPPPPPPPHSNSSAISRQWEIAEGRFASVALPPDPTVADVEILEEFLGLLKQELALVWKRKARGSAAKDGDQ